MAKKEKGRWITTDQGQHIHLGEDGRPDKGNPYVIAAMTGKARPEEDFYGKSYTQMHIHKDGYDLSDESAADLEEELGGRVSFNRDAKGNWVVNAESNGAMELAYQRLNSVGRQSFGEAYGDSIGEKFESESDARRSFQKEMFTDKEIGVGATEHASYNKRIGEGVSGKSFTKLRLHRDGYDLTDDDIRSYKASHGVTMKRDGSFWNISAKNNGALEEFFADINGIGSRRSIMDAMKNDTGYDFTNNDAARRYFRKHYFK